MKLLYPIFIITSIFLVNSGCYPIQHGHVRSVKIDFLQPAGTKIDPGLNRIAFINALHPNDSFAMVRLDSHMLKLPPPDAQLLAEKTVMGFIRQMTVSPRFEVAYLFSNQILPPATQFNWNWIDSTCTKYHLDGLILIQNMLLLLDIRSRLKYEYDAPDLANENGTVHLIYSDPFSSLYKLTIGTYWFIIQPARKEIIQCRTSASDSAYLMHYFSMKGSPWKNRMINEMANNTIRACADSFAMLISPLWVPSYRIIFDRGNRELRRAGKLFSKGKTEEAALIWKKNRTSKNLKISLFSRFNLAVYDEMRGLTDQALYEIKKLCIDSPLPEACPYKDILETRKSRESLLKFQLSKD